MDILEAMQSRHAVRAYLDKPIDAETLAALREEVAACNRESGLHMQLLTDEPRAFAGLMSRAGGFVNVKNYLALVGPKGDDAALEEKCGYYGERVALKAQALGLNSCWVAMSFSKGKCAAVVENHERLVIVVALGYGSTQGTPHKSKPASAVSRCEGEAPAWFRSGVEAALLAPTAVNQQKFRFTLRDGGVRAEQTGGFCGKIDLGIVKYHFELGAGRENVRWVEG